MCRSTDLERFYFNDQDRLKVKSFFVRLSNWHLHTKNKQLPPESLTLVYLPRINETALEISGKNIRPDSPAFVTLHRVIRAKTGDGEVIFGSRERVLASEGITFEVYFREEKVLKGIFRKDEDDEWKLECKCVLEREIVTGDVDGASAEVCVGLDGQMAMIERVEMMVKRKRTKRRACGKGLEEIPEEREAVVLREFESDGYCCTCGGEMESQGGSDGEDEEDINTDGVRWAVDVGIWVVCLGLGYLVSKASAKSLRRKRMLF